jgi:flagellar motor switch protein FliN/FliY
MEEQETTQTLEGKEETQPAPAPAEEAQAAKPEKAGLNRVLDVDLELRVELARVNLPIREILDISSGTVVNLKKAVGEPVNIYVNDKPLAKGEVVVVEDLLGIRITEISSPETREESLA